MIGRVGLLLGAVVAVVAVACASTATPTQAPVAVCALVPNMDALVGQTSVGAPGFFTLNGLDRCIWTYATDPARSVGVSVAPARAHQGAIDNFGQGETIGGVGDDARWFEGNRLLSILAGQKAVHVDLQLDEGDSTKDLAVAIGAAALANLH